MCILSLYNPPSHGSIDMSSVQTEGGQVNCVVCVCVCVCGELCVCHGVRVTVSVVAISVWVCM